MAAAEQERATRERMVGWMAVHLLHSIDLKGCRWMATKRTQVCHNILTKYCFHTFPVVGRRRRTAVDGG